MGPEPEAVVEIGVDGGEVESVIDGKQDKCHQQVAEDKTHAHLQIGHARGGYHAGDAHKGDSAYAGTYHAEGYGPPWRLAAGTEEGLVVVPAPCGERKQEQQSKIPCCNQYEMDGAHVSDYIRDGIKGYSELSSSTLKPSSSSSLISASGAKLL